MSDASSTTTPAATETKAPGEFHLARTFAAPRERVFAAFTEVEHLLNWWGPRDYPATGFESDPRPGGVYNMHMTGPGGEPAIADGAYEEVDPPSRLVTIANVRHEGRVIYQTRATVELTEFDGYTRVTVDSQVLVNEGFPGASGAYEGWSQQFDKLAEYLAVRASR